MAFPLRSSSAGFEGLDGCGGAEEVMVVQSFGEPVLDTLTTLLVGCLASLVSSVLVRGVAAQTFSTDISGLCLEAPGLDGSVSGAFGRGVSVELAEETERGLHLFLLLLLIFP